MLTHPAGWMMPSIMPEICVRRIEDKIGENVTLELLLYKRIVLGHDGRASTP